MKPLYNTVTFDNVWKDASTFLDSYSACELGLSISTNSARTLYYLLYARYGNSPIANYDVNQFKYKVMSVIYQYGPAWEKRMEIQTIFRNLNEEELRSGSKTVFNHAFNPSSEPSTSSLDELNQINEQSTNNYKKSKLEAYSMLWEVLRVDVTREFLDKFAICFKQVVFPEVRNLYASEE